LRLAGTPHSLLACLAIDRSSAQLRQAAGAVRRDSSRGEGEGQQRVTLVSSSYAVL